MFFSFFRLQNMLWEHGRGRKCHEEEYVPGGRGERKGTGYGEMSSAYVEMDARAVGARNGEKPSRQRKETQTKRFSVYMCPP